MSDVRSIDKQLTRNHLKFIDEFTAEKELGRGFGGTVLQSLSKLDNYRYAVKLIAVHPKNIDNALKEVRALAQLDHENIVRYNTTWIEKQPDISDFGPNDELLRRVHDEELHMRNYSPDNILIFIQMQLGDDTLHNWLIKNRTPQTRQRKDMLSFFEQIVKGVHHLHTKGFIHRDLKPLNILMFKGSRLKICDMGIVVRREFVNGREISICHNDVVTPAYASPEQNSAFREIDSKSDVFTLGLHLAELNVVMENKIKEEIFDNYRIGGRSDSIFGDDRELADFVARLTQQDRDKRPSCQDILDDLKTSFQ